MTLACDGELPSMANSLCTWREGGREGGRREGREEGGEGGGRGGREGGRGGRGGRREGGRREGGREGGERGSGRREYMCTCMYMGRKGRKNEGVRGKGGESE